MRKFYSNVKQFLLIVFLIFFHSLSNNVLAQCDTVNWLPNFNLAYTNIVRFPDRNTGYAATDEGIFKSIDMGTTWQLLSAGNALSSLADLCFADSATGFAVSGSSIFRTRNGGKDWDSLSIPTTFRLHAIYFIDSLTGFAGGEGGTLLRTIDGGNSWRVVNSRTTDLIRDICFTNDNTGYYITFRPGSPSASASESCVWKTTDGGTTWSRLSFQLNGNEFTSLYFSNALKGYITAGKGLIITTADGGNNWQTINTGYNEYKVNAIEFNGADKGIAVLSKKDVTTSSGLILRTSDGGTTWHTATTTPLPSINTICYADSATAFIAGDIGAMFIAGYRVPVAPEGIAGPASVCISQATYSVEALNTDNYHWSVSGGGKISGTGKTITVDWERSGLYQLSVTISNACRSTNLTLPVRVHSGVPARPTLTQGGTIVCPQSVQRYEITPRPGVNYQWSVTGGASVKSFGHYAEVTFADAGNYLVSVAGSNTCGTGEAEEISVLAAPGSFVPPGPITGSDTVCRGAFEAYQIAADPDADYEWSFTGPDGGQVFGNQNRSIVNFTRTGTYYLAVTPYFSCGYGTSSYLKVIVNDRIPGHISPVRGKTSVCTGTREIYHISNPDSSSYRWTLNGGGLISSYGDSLVVEWTTAGKYTISATPANGCGKGCASTLEIQVNNSVPVMQGLDNVHLNACHNTFSTITPPEMEGVKYEWQLSEGGRYTWSDSAVVQWTRKGIHSLRLTPVNGCGKGDVVTYKVTVDSTEAPAIQISGHYVSCSLASGYQWYSLGKPLTGIAAPSFMALQNGWYTVKVQRNGCWSEFADSVEVNGPFEEQSVIEPNPNRGRFMLGLLRTDSGSLKLFDLTGKEVWFENIQSRENYIHLPPQMKGMYLLQINTPEGIETKKMVVE